MKKSEGMTTCVIILSLLLLSFVDGITQSVEKTNHSLTSFLSSGNTHYINFNSKERISHIKEDYCIEEYVPGEFIIKFKNNINVDILNISDTILTGISSIDLLNKKYGIKNIEPLFKNKCPASLSNVYKITFPSDVNIYSVMDDYSRDIDVEYIEPNYIYHTCIEPNDPFFDMQWAFHQENDHDIDAPEAWDIEKGSDDVIIAIIDTGVDWDHPDLCDNIWINEDEIPDNGRDDDDNGYVDDIRGWDFVNTSLEVWPGEDGKDEDNNPMDFDGHGTHCAGIAGAVTNNGIGIAGTCWNCRIMALRAGYKSASGRGVLELCNIVKAIVYAVDNGAKIISMSYGAYTSPATEYRAIEYAHKKGVTLVAAAGNCNISKKFFPAGYDGVIAVSATNRNDEKADFSNFGYWVDVAAPGVEIYSTYFDDCYRFLEGTSMSCPFVAGLSALILSKNQNLSPEEVKTILKSTVDPVKSKEYIGVGRINAYKALSRNSTPIVEITSPKDGTVVEGSIELIGNAYGETFQSYTVEYGYGIYPSEWIQIDYSDVAVENNVLTKWDTSTLPDGLYTVRLRVTDSEEKVSQDIAILRINNFKKHLYVGGTGTNNYSKVQDAINVADWGDTIFIHKGIYYENIIIDKSIELIGESRNETIIDGMEQDYVIKIIAPCTIISNLSIRNCGYTREYVSSGIEINRGHISIINCVIRDNHDVGISFWNIENCLVSGCTFENPNSWTDIAIVQGRNIVISDCSFYNKGVLYDEKYGYIESYYADIEGGAYNIIKNCSFIDSTNETSYCIRLYGCYKCTIKESNFYNDYNCFVFYTLSYQHFGKTIANKITNCNMSNTIRMKPNSKAIFLETNSEGNIIENNIIRNFEYGIVLGGGFGGTSSYNIMRQNIICSNKIGIFLWDSSPPYGNLLYHNSFIENSIQVRQVESSPNIWNLSYPICGNYWDDYEGEDNYRGPNQDIPGADGIGDTPYKITGDIIDAYPLINPWVYSPLEIKNISGGFGVSAIIKNIGNESIYNLEWSINLSGLVFIGRHVEGSIKRIDPNESVIIRNRFIFGLGPATITIKVAKSFKTARCFIIGPFALGVY